MYDSSFGWRFVNQKMHDLYGTDGMGNTAENLVEKYNISREDQDAFAYWSQMKATNAQKSGRLAKEITTVEIPQRKKDPILFSDDEFIKPTTTKEVLAKLRPAFKKEGSVTAGNASGLNDGAAATIIASEDAVKKYNLKPLARIVSSAVVGVEPRIMGIGPVKAIPAVLKRAGMKMQDIEQIELNEAFASQSVAVLKELNLNPDIVNVNGGAIAMGHPLGCTGAKLSVQLFNEMRRRKQQYGMVTMCVGAGQGAAGIYELLR
jgi:acetyl-CoA acetyltransferase family protein